MKRIMLNEEGNSSISIERVKLKSGKHCISLRQWYKKKGDENWNPGRQGILIPVDVETRTRKAIRLCAEDEKDFKDLSDLDKKKKKRSEDEDDE